MVKKLKDSPRRFYDIEITVEIADWRGAPTIVLKEKSKKREKELYRLTLAEAAHVSAEMATAVAASLEKWRNKRLQEQPAP